MQILIAEDERITRRQLHRQLQRAGHDVIEAADGREAWALFQSHAPPIVVCDWEMPEMNGVDLVRHIRAADNPGYVYIIMLTGRSDKDDVVAGIEAGADDFVTKPFDANELRARLNAGVRIVELEHNLATANDRLRHELAVARELADAEHRKHEEPLLGESSPVQTVRNEIRRHATTNDPLLLTGPPGSGQEAVARAIHRSSARGDRPFIYVACAHIAGSDESLFGGGPDAGVEGRFGKASLADGGTLYLEGLESLGKALQTELLRYLTADSGDPSLKAGSVPDTRIIAYASPGTDAEPRATVNPALEKLLGIHRIAIPSLAERREDIVVIAQTIVDRHATTTGKAIDHLSANAGKMLHQYSWPGNVRELQNVMERAVTLASGMRLEIPEELLREGRRIAGYTLERKLGAGAMGEVWLAKHALLARPSAVKLIRQDALRANADARERLETSFRREAQATAGLRSPHTVELYDFGVTDEGDFYYVMEFLTGMELGSLVKKFGALPPARAAHLLKQAAMSLAEAHLAGLVHRDIKPANLLTCQLGPHYDFLKLLDFGIVRKTSDAKETALSALDLPGTPNSLSPEVIDGQPATFASDLYGFGCVAYWLLAGRHPFKAPSLSALLKMHTSETPTPPSKINGAVTRELEELVMCCLAKSPADRPGSAFEIHRTLSALPLQDRWDNEIARLWWNENLPELQNDMPGSESGPTDVYADTVVITPGNTDG